MTQIDFNKKELLLAYVIEKFRDSTGFRQSWIGVLQDGCSSSACLLLRQVLSKVAPGDSRLAASGVEDKLPIDPGPLSLSWIL